MTPQDNWKSQANFIEFLCVDSLSLAMLTSFDILVEMGSCCLNPAVRYVSLKIDYSKTENYLK